MTILSGQTIRRYCQGDRPLITPFAERTDLNGLTYGLGPAGYDFRLAQAVFLGDDEPTDDVFALASTMERVCLPDQIVGLVHDKSTWARQGLAVQNTLIDPGFEGYVTLELSFHGQGGLYIEAGTPICQMTFHYTDEPVEEPYAGKYQNQEAGPQAARR